MEIRNILNNNTLNINESNSTDKITSVKEEKVEKENIEVKDRIELSADENAINSKKAFDALCEVSKEVGTDNEDKVSFHVEFLAVMNWMKNDGIAVPNFTDKNDKSFIDFVDEMKSYVSKNTATGRLKLYFSPDEFLGFCDLYKQKLIEAGCK